MLRRAIFFFDNLLARIASALLRLVPIHTQRARCLLLREGEVLLIINRLSHKGQRWTLPGGGIKNGESVEMAAVREVAEELDITLRERNIRRLGAVEYAHGKLREQLEIVVAEPGSKDFTRQKLELLSAEWFPVADLPQSRQQVVDEAIKLLNSKT